MDTRDGTIAHMTSKEESQKLVSISLLDLQGAAKSKKKAKKCNYLSLN